MKTEKYLLSKVETMQFVLPEHLNHMENMHGGEIMKLMDNTAGLAFIRHAQGDAVTAAANDINFIKPIPAKSIVKCTAEVVKVGTSSMETYVEVWVENVETRNTYIAATGTFIGVAIDKEGNTRQVLPLER